jgi:Sporulation and spore germination
MTARQGIAARRAPIGVVAALAASALLAGCGLGAQSAPQALATQSASPRLQHPEPPSSTSVPRRALARVTIFLEGSDEDLRSVHREVLSPATLQEIMDQLVAGPHRSESSKGLVSPASSVGSFSVGPFHDGVVTVDLPVSFENLSGQDQTAAAAQIVFTATTFTGVAGVRFLVGGQPAQVPNGNGSLSPGPSTRRDYSVFAN